MGVTGLNAFLKARDVEISSDLTASQAVCQAWDRIGRPACMKIHLDAKNVFYNMHQHLAKTTFCPPTLAKRFPRRSAAGTDASARSEVQARTCLQACAYLSEIYSDLPLELQRACSFEIYVDNPTRIPLAKKEEWLHRHGSDLLRSHDLDNALDEPTTLHHSQLLRKYTTAQLGRCVPFPSAKSFQSSLQLSTNPLLSLQQSGKVKVIDCSTEADFAFSHALDATNSTTNISWTTDGDWLMAASSDKLPYNIRCVATFDANAISSTACVWDVKQADRSLQVTCLAEKRMLRVVVGDDYSKGIPGLGISRALKWQLQSTSPDGLAAHVASTIRKSKLKNKATAWLSLHQNDLSSHFNLVTGASEVPALPVSDLLVIAQTEPLRDRDSIRLPFNPASFRPMHVQQVLDARQELETAGFQRHSMPAGVALATARNPGRQTLPLSFQPSRPTHEHDSGDGDNQRWYPRMPPHEGIFTSRSPEEPFQLSDSTKVAPRKPGKASTSSAHRTTYVPPSTSQLRLTQKSQDAAAEAARIASLPVDRQELLQELRNNDSDETHSSKNQQKSIKSLYARAIRYAVNQNVFQHLTSTSADTNDHSLSQLLQAAAAATSLTLPTFVAALNALLEEIAKSSNIDVHKVMNASENASTGRLLWQCLTLNPDVRQAWQILSPQDQRHLANIETLARQCSQHSSVTIRADNQVSMSRALRNISPLTAISCMKNPLLPTTNNNQRFIPYKNLCVELVLAVDQVIKLDMPMFTLDHVGGLSACQQLAGNCHTHLKASLLTQVEAWVQHQLIGLCGKTSGYNLSMHHRKKLAVAIVEHDLQAPLDAWDSDAAQALFSSTMTNWKLPATTKEQLVQVASDVATRLWSILSHFVGDRASTYHKAIVGKSRSDPTAFIPMLVFLGQHLQQPFGMRCSRNPAIHVTSNEVKRLCVQPLSLASTLQAWFGTLPTARELLTTDMSSRGSSQPVGYKQGKVPKNPTGFFFDNILQDPFSKTGIFALSKAAAESLKSWTAALNTMLPVDSHNKAVAVGDSLFADLVLRRGNQPAYLVPTLDLIVRPGSVSLTFLDLRQVLDSAVQQPRSPEDVVGCFASLAKILSGNGCSLIRAADFDIIQTRRQHLRFWANHWQSYHSHCQVEALSDADAAHKAAGPVETANSGAQAYPTLLSLPFEDLASARNSQPDVASFQDSELSGSSHELEEAERPAPDSMSISLQSNACSARLRYAADTSLVPLEGLANLKKLQNGWPKLVQRANRKWALKWLQSPDRSLLSNFTAAQRAACEQLTEVSAPEDWNKIDAAQGLSTNAVFIGVDLGEICDFAANLRVFDKTGKALQLNLAFTRKALRAIAKQAQQKRNWVNGRLAFDFKKLANQQRDTLQKRVGLTLAGLTRGRAQANIQQRRQQDQHLHRRVRQLKVAIGASSKAIAHNNTCLGDRQCFLVVGDGYNDEKSGWGKKTIYQLAFALHKQLGDRLTALRVSEFCSSQVCIDPGCQRPRQKDWEQRDDLEALLLRAKNGTLTEQDPVMIRSRTYPATYSLSGNSAFRVMQCERCKLVLHRDTRSGAVIWQSVVHLLRWGRHPFEPASQEQWGQLAEERLTEPNDAEPDDSESDAE